MAAFLDINKCLNMHGEPYRVRKILSPDEVELVHLKTCNLLTLSRKEFLSLYSSGELVLPDRYVNESDIVGVLLSDWPQDVQDEVQYKLKWVEAIEENGVKLSENKLKQFIKQYAPIIEDNSPPSYSKLQRWIRAWKKAERSPFALISGDKSRKSSTRKSALIERLISEAISSVYYESSETSIIDTVDWINGELLKPEYRGLKNIKLSESTVRRRIKDIPEFERMSCKFGRSYALKVFSERKDVVCPSRILEVVEIDETPADIYVIDNNGLPLGRPTLICVLDIFSRMNLAIHLSFEPPSTSTALHAIRQAILPKNDLLEKLSTVNSDWPAYGIMDAIKSDNITHYLSDDFIGSLAELKISHIKTPVGVPNFKGRIERLFAIVNNALFRRSEGYVKALKERFTELDIEPSTQAVITLDELNELLHKYFVDVYQFEFHRGLEGRPRDVWDDSMEAFDVRFDEPLKKIEVATRNTFEATIQEDGTITRDYLVYSSPETKHLRAWLMKNRTEHKFKNPMVKIKWDYNDLSNIYVFDTRTKDYMPAFSRQSRYTKGLTEYQHRLIREEIAARKISAVNEEVLIRAKREVLDACLAMKKKSKLFGGRRAAARATESLPSTLLRESNIDDDMILTGLANDVFGNEYSDDLESIWLD